ncbi:MAG: MotA/TolQ/ExbB proton channel family protein [Desulfobacterales bacterium]|nr:MAG: MotA/TolQ/ExbB proton channel family protein [Desulfobacterales bacterium]
MDIATIIGLLGGSALILLSILLGGDANLFFNLPGLLIVVGGTVATCFIKFSMKDVINSVSVAMKAFTIKIQPQEEIMEKMISLAKIAKESGLIALENEKLQDEFSSKSFQYVVDGFDEEQLRILLQKDIMLTIQRHTIGQKVFKGMGASAPAFGMIGTLIGLVQMLANMSNPNSIGPAMAVALLTTLYGALLSNLVFLPLADKLALRTQQEQETKNLILDAVLGISQGLGGLILQETLKVHLAPKDRLKIVPKAKSEASV